MGRGNQNHKNRDKNAKQLPQVPKNLKTDGQDVEYSSELADQEDVQAQVRAAAAGQRQGEGITE